MVALPALAIPQPAGVNSISFFVPNVPSLVGLGETLVSGNYPGRALAFTRHKSGTKKPELVSYPSKNEALIGEAYRPANPAERFLVGPTDPED